MKSFLLFTLTALAALAQGSPSDLFEKAPPDVDQALRERVKAFYQHHIDGTYRKAEKFVAEESQDYFYQVQKQRYDSCEPIKFAYADSDFTKATVTMACKGKWVIQGNEMSVSMPLSSSWKREKGGEWFWHHVQPQKMPTPFGDMDHRAALNPGKDPAPAAAGGLQIPSDMKAAAEMLLKQVSIDKADVKLSSYEKSSDTVVVSNNSTAPVKLKFEYEALVPGFKAELDKTEIAPGEKTTIKFTMNPKDRVPKPTLLGRVLVDPLLQQFQVKIVFGIPPEIEKQLPKD